MTHKPQPANTNPQPDPRTAAIGAHTTKRAEERAKRSGLIQKIAQDRKSVVIAYVTSSRGNLGAQIGMDVIRLFREHLGKIAKVKKLNLLLVTHGGNTLTPLRLVTLLREFSSELTLLIPYMAHSAGTLIGLGGDEILMGAMGELGPVDPSVSNQFNPILETEDIQGPAQKPRPRIPISVEDVTAYLNFAKNHANLEPDGMSEAYKSLTEKVHLTGARKCVKKSPLDSTFGTTIAFNSQGNGWARKSRCHCENAHRRAVLT